MRSWALLIGLGLGLGLTIAACGRSTLRLPSAGSTTGSGGSGGESSASATTADVSASSSGGAGGWTCGVEPHDTVQIALQTFQGALLGCATGTAMTGEVEEALIGEIIGVDDGVITIDSCSPKADCAGQFSKLTIKAPGFHPYLALGAYVEVRIRERAADTCVDTVMIQNLPSWDGVTNPVSTGEGMWLAASSGHEAFEDAPYQLDIVSQGCLFEPTAGCGEREDYLFRVSVDGSPFDVEMGTAREVGAPAQWVFRNVTSYTSGLCDDVPHFAYWMEIPILD